MSIQAVQGCCVGNRLQISWILLADPVERLSVQISQQSDFTPSAITRHFIIPKTTGAAFDIGHGAFYYRVGAWKEGRVEWSGTYGPTTVFSKKRMPLPPKPAIAITRTQTLVGGLRFHTGNDVEPKWAVVEVSRTEDFRADACRTVYVKDTWQGFFDVMGIDSSQVWHVRIATLRTIPEGAIVTLPDWQGGGSSEKATVVIATPASRPFTPADRASRLEGDALLQEHTERRKPFLTGSDYTKWLAAKTMRTGR